MWNEDVHLLLSFFIVPGTEQGIKAMIAFLLVSIPAHLTKGTL